jgi:GAF domain-containing protein
MEESTYSVTPPAASKPISDRSIAGVRVSAILEIAAFLAGALLLDSFFFDGTRFRSASQHPFWILVLLVSSQYGTNAGLLAAIAASAALLSGKLPPETISQDRFSRWFEIGKLPLMWFISALVLGELRVRQIRERGALQEELVETARREQVIADAYRRLSGVRDALETRLASQMKTAVGLYESVRAIEKLNPSEVLMGVGDLVRSVVNPERFSTYLVRDGRLELAAAEGRSGVEELRRSYGPETDLFVEIVAKQRVLSVANPNDVAVLAGAGVAAVPIVAPRGARVVGMLKIEKLGFLDLTFSNLQMLRALGQWIGAAWENAMHYQAARAESVVNTETELFAYGFLSRQLAFLSVLAARVRFDLTMVVVRLENADDLTHDQRALVPRAFGRAASQSLRKTDLAFDYQRTGTEFALILPASRVSHADVVVSKLKASLSAVLAEDAPAARFSFAVHVVHESDPGAGTDLVGMAKALDIREEIPRHA